MIARFKAAYDAQRRVRLATLIGLGVAAIALLATGGFPPWAWRFLFQVLSQLSRLWEVRGLAMLLPFVGLLMLALTQAILWCAIVLAAVYVVRDWLQRRRDMQAFELELAEAGRSVGTPFDAFAAPLAPPFAASAPVALASRQYEQQETRPVGRSSKARTTPVAVVEATEDLEQSVVSLEIGSALDCGIKRKGQPNEDSLLALPNLRSSRKGIQPVALFVVADGMGGHGNGQEASRLAIAALHDALRLALLDGLTDMASNPDMFYEELLAEGTHNANLAIYQRNRQKQTDMGTTLTAALIVGNTAYIANVGDSRTYLYRQDEGLSQLTRDHSAVARLVEVGAITPREVYSHPKRNEIYRSLGNSSSVKVDTYSVPLRIGDLLLLCSDGLWEMVYDDDIAAIIASWMPTPAHICEALLQAALRGGGKDNISIIAVR
ncbi:MAG TPA: protein phosphatase 2C domain-containing protein, partial [Ktedonobacteraceae bacterium]|nr:protein phosphatase 2C domain-containing protein [Ktedonobacteraceae bacterium]